MYYTNTQVNSPKEWQFAYLETHFANHVFTIVLNRPQKRNAMNTLFMNEIAFALAHAHYNPQVRVVVIEAKGSIFCAGADLNAFAGNLETVSSTVPEPQEPVKLGDAFARLFKPCIAQVHAAVYAGGFLILGGCSHVIASEEAQFGLPEVRRGIWPFQVMASLMSIVPERILLDWCMRGHVFNAHEAKSAGIVTEIVEPQKLRDAVQSLASELSANAPLAIQRGMSAYYQLKSLSQEKHHAYLYDQLQELLKTQDAAEGINAFSEKRKPVWKGN
jgi:enoyl-CoA hydratase/carnithine racemase